MCLSIHDAAARHLLFSASGDHQKKTLGSGASHLSPCNAFDVGMARWGHLAGVSLAPATVLLPKAIIQMRGWSGQGNLQRGKQLLPSVVQATRRNSCQIRWAAKLLGEVVPVVLSCFACLNAVKVQMSSQEMRACSQPYGRLMRDVIDKGHQKRNLAGQAELKGQP